MTNLELTLVRPPRQAPIPAELIVAQKTAAGAFSLSCSVSGLEDKELYLALGIDAGHWSRMKKGEAGFPPDRISDFCELVGNMIYPEWIAYQVGCALVMIKSEAERRLEAEHSAREKVEAENRLLRELLVGRAA